MPTFSQLQTTVLANVIDQPTAVRDQVPALINAAQRKLQVQHGFKVCEAISSVYITAASTRVLAAVPSNWCRWRNEPYLIERSGQTSPLAILESRDDANRLYGTTAGGEYEDAEVEGKPQALLIDEPDTTGGANFEVYPLSDGLSTYSQSSVGQYRIQVPYWKYLAALSAGSDTNWFTENADEFLIYQATSEAFFLNQDGNNGVAWAQRAAAKYQEVVLRDKKQRWSSIQTLHFSNRAGRGNYGR